MQGLQFTLLENVIIPFSIADNQLSGLNFTIYQAGIPWDAVRFPVFIKRDLQEPVNIRRTLRNKVEL